MRISVEPRDVPATQAARRLGKSLTDFEALLPRLIGRGFPEPDPDTGNFDLDAIDAWRRTRHPHLFLTEARRARDARSSSQHALTGQRLGKVRIPYYVVRKGRGYWLPTPKMKALGFPNVRCGAKRATSLGDCRAVEQTLAESTYWWRHFAFGS